MVNERKKEAVETVKKLCKEYPIIGVVNMQSLPAAQLQRMRKKLQDKVQLYMTKKRLIKRALEEIKDEKPGIEQLEEKMKGMPALLFTSENPFRLYKTLEKNMSSAAAKPGQEAPKDIVVQAGPTNFAPGPIISELGNIGLKTKVDQGKIAITEDATVVKEGEEINENLASMLQKLGIEPMEVGLDLVSVYEDGTVYGKDVLAIDEKEYEDNIVQAFTWGFNLAVEAGVFTDKTREFLVQKAFKEAKAIALEGDVLTPETVGEVLGKAERGARSLQTNLEE